ncbi:DUF4258 domain-containing protein [candidate division KSB1 bacterium]|nr:DUF4258 domain-containing protein [candidate division KSB1 bacterium]
MWPEWWNWELEFTPHLDKRLSDRDLTEIDLRIMFDNASGYARDNVEGRWIVKTRHKGKRWEIIVEPDFEEKLLVVITVYPVIGG